MFIWHMYCFDRRERLCFYQQTEGIAAELIVKDILQTLELKSLVTVYQYGGVQKF
jgi:hypothetical protein